MATVQFEEGVDWPSPLLQRDQLIVNIVDGLGRARPQSIYAEFPRSPAGYEEGFQKLTYRAFVNAVNGLAWMLTAQLGKSKSFETLVYTGPNDFRINALILACVKTGYKLLLPSPRNQAAALKSLLNELDCKAILAAEFNSPSAGALRNAKDVPIFQISGIDILLREAFPHYPYGKTFEQAKDDPLFVLHTSGTTSTPKPIVYTNGWAARYTSALQLPPPTNYDSSDIFLTGGRLLVMMPPFHAANHFPTFFSALTCQVTIIFPPGLCPPTVEVFLDGIRNTSVDTAFIPPHFVAQLAEDPKKLEIVGKHVETIFSGGGTIAKSAGDTLSSRVQFFTKYASTEMGSIPCIRPAGQWPRETWSYITPHPSAGLEFRLQTNHADGEVYEAYVVKGKSAPEQPIFQLFPDIKEFRTRDLFRRHSQYPNMWDCCGRVDDTIVLTTGANVSPFCMEEGVARVKDVNGVLVVGTGKPRPALMVELRDQEVISLQDTLDRIWETIEKLNDEYFADHQILKSHILVTKLDKPMCRSTKGTVQRSTTIEMYADELRQIYAAA